MATYVTSWINFGNFSDVAGPSSLSGHIWSSPSYAQYQDGNAAYVDGVSPASDWLYCKNLLSSPGIQIGGKIRGVEIALYAMTAIGHAPPDTTTLRTNIIKAGSRVGSNRDVGTSNCIGGTTCWSSVVAGGAADLFGTTLSVTDITDANFGVAIQALPDAKGYGSTYYVDHVKIRFHYDQVGMLLTI